MTATTAAPTPETTAASATPLVAAAIASLGAGAIHAAAIGVHSEHRAAVLAFTAVAGAQLAWGALALTRGGRALIAVGVVVQGAALTGWLLAKTTGLGLIDGLGVAESVQVADGIAAGLAGLSLVLGIRRLVEVTLGSAHPDGGPATPRRWGRAVLVAGVAGLSVAAAVSATTHSHPGDEVAAGGHDHGGASAETEADLASSDPDAPADHGDHGASDDQGDHTDHSAEATPTPYDPTQPIDLSGVDGVTPEQQAAAENLVAITLARLPQFADPAEAEAAGYSSIGDGATGHEHLIKWDALRDGRILDPDQPESLVYDTSGGGRELVSAMFMLEPGSTLDQVPELGGALTQWHIHDNLCFTEGDNPRVAGITTVGGPCPAGLAKLTPVPMIHVWITPHACGPFAALEGIAAGQVAEGEEHLCDHAHGA